MYKELFLAAKHLVHNEVVNYVQKHIYELGMPNPSRCFVKTYENVFRDFSFEHQRAIRPREVRCSRRMPNTHDSTKVCHVKKNIF